MLVKPDVIKLLVIHYCNNTFFIYLKLGIISITINKPVRAHWNASDEMIIFLEIVKTFGKDAGPACCRLGSGFINSHWDRSEFIMEKWTTTSFNFHQMAVHKRTTMLAHCNLKQNMWLCSKQSSLFSFYALPSGGKSKDAVVHF